MIRVRFGAMRNLKLALPILLCSAQIAFAGGWHNAKWGMSPAEVRAATGGGDYPTQAVDDPGASFKNAKCLLQQYFSMGDMGLAAYFCFSVPENRLVLVSIKVPRDHCSRVGNTITSAFGTPNSETTNIIGRESDWQSGDTKVVFFAFSEGGGCSFQFQQVP